MLLDQGGPLVEWGHLFDALWCVCIYIHTYIYVYVYVYVYIYIE